MRVQAAPVTYNGVAHGTGVLPWQAYVLAFKSLHGLYVLAEGGLLICLVPAAASEDPLFFLALQGGDNFVGRANEVLGMLLGLGLFDGVRTTEEGVYDGSYVYVAERVWVYARHDAGGLSNRGRKIFGT